MYWITISNTTHILKCPHICHANCQHSLSTLKPPNALRVMWSLIDFVQYSKLCKSLTNLSLHWFVCYISINYIPKTQVISYWAEGNWNCDILEAVHHIAFNILSSPRSPKLLLHSRVSKCNYMCIFNFSSKILLSHLSHSAPVHHTPPLNLSCPICRTPHQFSTNHHSIYVVPSAPLHFSSPPNTIQFILFHLYHSTSVHHPPPFKLSCPVCPTPLQFTTHHH